MRVHCKACDNKPFNSWAKLRQHQWTEHREVAMGKRLISKALVVRPIDVPEMSAKSLLAKLRSQAEFMHDVVTLVEGLIK